MHEFDDCFDTNFLCVLASVVGEDGVLMAEPMRDHTTFNIGGPADVMILPRTRDEVVRVLDICLTGGVGSFGGRPRAARGVHSSA